MEWSLVEAVLATLNGPNYCNDAFHRSFGHGTFRSISEIFASPQLINNQRKCAREMEKGGTESTLLDVLARFRHTESTDPRDMVFALLGLASNTLGIKADYHKPKRDVYIDVARTLIDYSANLDILCQSAWGLHNEETLPKWVPNFGADIDDDDTFFLFAQRGIFCAGDQHCDTPCQISADGCLSLPGIELGKVAHMREIAPYSYLYGYETSQQIRLINYLRARSYMPDEVLRVQDQEGEEEEEEDKEISSPERIANKALYESFWRTVSVDCKVYPMVRLSTPDIHHDLAILKSQPKLPPLEEDQAIYDLEDLIDETKLNSINKLSDLKMGKCYQNILEKMKFATLGCGQYAMVPLKTEEGDRVVVLRGAKVPLVVRAIEIADRESKEDMFTIVGGAYVHGFMDGEARVQVEKGFLEEKMFTLA